MPAKVGMRAEYRNTATYGGDTVTLRATVIAGPEAMKGREVQILLSPEQVQEIVELSQLAVDRKKISDAAIADINRRNAGEDE